MKKRIIIGIIIATYSIGCSQAQLHMSHPSSALIDGNLTEWADQLVVPDGSKIAVGIKHDDNNIYVALGLIDRMTVMQAVTRGFIIWFDPTGKKKREVGIHYPLQDKNRPPMGIEMGQDQMNPEDIEYILKTQLENQYFFEYLEDEGKSIQQIGLENDLGIKIKTQYKFGEFSYELQIPYAIVGENIDATTKISIGITTPEMSREDMGMQNRPEDGGMGGQRPSGGGSRGGGMGRGGGGKGGPGGGRSGMQRPEPLDLWLYVSFDNK